MEQANTKDENDSRANNTLNNTFDIDIKVYLEQCFWQHDNCKSNTDFLLALFFLVCFLVFYQLLKLNAPVCSLTCHQFDVLEIFLWKQHNGSSES